MSAGRFVPFVVLALLLSVSSASVRAAPPAVPSTQEPPIVVQAAPINLGAPEVVRVSMSATPPQLSQAQQAELAARESARPWPAAVPLPVGDTAVQRPDSVTPANGGTRGPLAGEADAAPSAPSAPDTFTLFRNSNMGTTIKANTSGNTGEPNAGNSGAIVFATGNWWAAISSDGGQHFGFINPITFFGSVFGGFCCDQHALYDPSRDIFIWYLQYNSSGAAGAGQNAYRMAVARPQDALQGIWWVYTINSATNTEWDYPDMCLSNNSLYITTNRGVFNSLSVNDAFIFKWPLDSMATGAGLSGGVVDLGANGITNLSLKCTHGAREVMYFGAHNNTSQIRIFSWADDSGQVFLSNINLSATWNNGTHVCPTPDSRNWCGFDDGRIKTGWVQSTRQGHLIGFMWNASGAGGASNCNGTALSCPYIEAARASITDLTNERTYAYYDRPFLFASGNTAAFQYGAASPNARGDLGVTAYYSSAAWDPYFLVGLDDDYHRTVNGSWDVRYVRASTQGPDNQTQQRWGDYFEVQPFAPNSLGWITTGQTLQGCGIAGCKETQYVIFGRERDLRSVQLYYNPIFGLALPLIRR